MTAATQELPDLGELTGKKVTLTFTVTVPAPTDENPDATTVQTVTQEGRVEMGSDAGVMFKEKGKSNVQLLDRGDIISVQTPAPKLANVTRKKLLPVAEGRMRQHLADRHGMPLAEVNPLTEEQAVELHDGIDHETLAHRHVVPDAQTDAESTPAESTDPLGTDGGAEPEDDYASDDED